jgi:hypothetical protein
MVLALAAVAVGGVAIVAARPWDPHLSEREVERRLAKRITMNERLVKCDALNSNDGSLQLDDVDYECRVGRAGSLIWLGTNNERITEVAGGGP